MCQWGGGVGCARGNRLCFNTYPLYKSVDAACDLTVAVFNLWLAKLATNVVNLCESISVAQTHD